jgi:DNA mismatch repair protein MutS2
MGRVKDIVTQVTASSLVLLDELGSGTDPSEGGALAVAILDFLRSRGCTAIVTTHLNILKTYAYTRPDVENVSVGFDPATRRPNYSLIYGVPGFSNAIEIARSMGIPDEILTNAGGYLEGADRQVAELIHGLEKTQVELAGQKDVLRASIHLGQRFHRAAESLYESMREQREKILRQFETEARRLLRRSQDELMKLIKEQKRRTLVRPGEDVKHDDAARAQFADVKKKLHDRFPRKEAPEAEPVAELAAGQAVLVKHLGKQGIVLSADNGTKKAEVEVGSLRVKTTYGELALAPAGMPPKQAAPKKAARQAAPSAGPAIARKVNVIGMRVEEALPVVDKAIDTALLENADTIEVIHGRGTGRLMTAIHEHLKESPYVEGFHQGGAEEGGSGLTVVTIK